MPKAGTAVLETQDQCRLGPGGDVNCWEHCSKCYAGVVGEKLLHDTLGTDDIIAGLTKDFFDEVTETVDNRKPRRGDLFLWNNGGHCAVAEGNADLVSQYADTPKYLRANEELRTAQSKSEKRRLGEKVDDLAKENPADHVVRARDVKRGSGPRILRLKKDYTKLLTCTHLVTQLTLYWQCDLKGCRCDAKVAECRHRLRFWVPYQVGSRTNEREWHVWVKQGKSERWDCPAGFKNIEVRPSFIQNSAVQGLRDLAIRVTKLRPSEPPPASWKRPGTP